MRKITSLVTFVLLALSMAWLAGAQAPDPSAAMKIVEARKANHALMQQYTWNSRTELFINGEQKDIRIDQVQYGPNGQLQKTELNNESFSHPRGFLRKAIAKEKKEELEKYMQGLKALLEQYTLPTAGKVIDFMSGATVTSDQSPDGKPLFKMQGNGVIVPGDTLAIWADASTHKMKKVQITTFYEGAPANLTATYKTNAAGLTYMSMAEIDLPEKNISLQIHNYDYEQND